MGFLNAAVLYVLSRADLHGVPLHDIERRRTLVMAVMLGEAGAKSVERVAERTGQHWGRQLVKNIPQARIKAINDVLGGRHFVTKYGTKEGIIVLGRVIPLRDRRCHRWRRERPHQPRNHQGRRSSLRVSTGGVGAGMTGLPRAAPHSGDRSRSAFQVPLIEIDGSRRAATGAAEVRPGR